MGASLAGEANAANSGIVWFRAASRKFAQQRLRFLQIARVETFGEPAVHRIQQFVRLLHLIRRALCSGRVPALRSLR